jgi:predicted ATP-grasp superfamily ATP-dependent carboligase
MTMIDVHGPILVTDGNERAALAVTRGLGQAEIPVIVGAETRRSLAGASRYCAGKWQYPSPLNDPEPFISSLMKAVEQFHIKSIMPVTDATVQVLGERREVLPSTVRSSIPLPDKYNSVSDKFRLMQLAEQLSIPIPNTIYVQDGDVAAIADRLTSYPVVVKPGRSLLQVNGQWSKTSVHFVSTGDDLIELYRRIPYLRQPSLIQERIKGNGQGLFGLFDHGKPCALFAHRRIREKPPAGGVSVFRESIELPKPMTDYAVRLMERVKWHGVAMVEFKIDDDSGVPMLMEINGRFWGSLQLSLDAGLNFPYLLNQMIHGAEVTVPAQAYRIGVKSRWLLGDLDHLLLRMTRSRAHLQLDSSAPSRWRCLLDFYKLVQRDLHYEIERLNDPGPALVEYRTWLGQLMGNRA